MPATDAQQTVRIDKWLWAARFFKTRGLATDAINGGHVHLNGARVKPARPVRPGDELRIRKGPAEFVVIVRGISSRRGPAKEASALFEETEASRTAREAQIEQRKLLRSGGAPPPRRPDKQARRQIRRFTGKD
jgi:ribosome-associated heat shock protein Hsp15